MKKSTSPCEIFGFVTPPHCGYAPTPKLIPGCWRAERTIFSMSPSAIAIRGLSYLVAIMLGHLNAAATARAAAEASGPRRSGGSRCADRIGIGSQRIDDDRHGDLP